MKIKNEGVGNVFEDKPEENANTILKDQPEDPSTIPKDEPEDRKYAPTLHEIKRDAFKAHLQSLIDVQENNLNLKKTSYASIEYYINNLTTERNSLLKETPPAERTNAQKATSKALYTNLFEAKQDEQELKAKIKHVENNISVLTQLQTRLNNEHLTGYVISQFITSAVARFHISPKIYNRLIKNTEEVYGRQRIFHIHENNEDDGDESDGSFDED